MPYIKKNILSFGSKENEIKRNVDALMYQIYNNIPLDHASMLELYIGREVPCSFDDEDSDEHNDYYRHGLKFCPHPEPDDKYIYTVDSFDIDGDLHEKTQKFLEEINEYLGSKSAKKLILKGITDLTVTNDRNVNKDARGIRFLDWRLHFWKKFSVQREEIRLHDLIIAAHKVESHKFDTNYEMYVGVLDVSVIDSSLKIKVDFDHGS